MTVKEIFETKIADKFRLDPAKAKAVNAVIGFNITGADGGYWTIDCKKPGGEVVSGKRGEPDMQVTVSSEDFIGLFTGKSSGMMLFLAGKIKVEGDMGLAMKLKEMI